MDTPSSTGMICKNLRPINSVRARASYES
jgi:hypothetical protein